MKKNVKLSKKIILGATTMFVLTGASVSEAAFFPSFNKGQGQGNRFPNNPFSSIFNKGESKPGLTLPQIKFPSFNGGSSSSLPVKPEIKKMHPKTAVDIAGKEYDVELAANVYIHKDANGKPDSDKWVLLVHPFMLDGTKIASKVGPFYYEKGYNIFAPDLRSFGNSKGEVALGFVESLDVYDWLNYLNSNYGCSEVFIHGISLGGATTNFVSGVDQFIANGPVKLNYKLKSLRDLKVVALVEDCGFTDMTEFQGKNQLLNRKIGMTSSTFDYYSKATNSLKYCDLPMLIIHGTSDSNVKVRNADIVASTVKGPVEKWMVNGAMHAFIIMGNNKDEYKAHVQNHINKYGNPSETTPIVPPEKPQEPDIPTEPNNPSKPEIPHLPDLPSKPEIPHLPDLPSKPEIPHLPDLPNKPEIPHLPDLPSKPEIPHLPDLPSKPEIPHLPDLPSKPEIPHLPDLPNKPEKPQLPELPNMPELPEMPQLPNKPGNPNKPQLPELPQMPDLPGKPELPNLPNLPDMPNMPELPNLPEMPQLPGFPSNKETLKITEIKKMHPKTAVDISGKEYDVELSANVYIHKDENGNPDSNKWALLVHPFLNDGTKIVNNVGPFYYEKGYNIFAPDLRSAGKSKGEIGIGFLESLDVYDWLNYLNKNYECSEVFIHGISLGGATTNFISGIDQFIANGPVKLNYKLKSLRELKVVGLVEDCGFTDMEEFQGKDQLLKRKIGMTSDTFDYYSKATNSLKYCDLPMLIIHGTNDKMVKVKNADVVALTVKGPVEKWMVDGESHAFIMMGADGTEYREHVHNHIDKYTRSEIVTPPTTPQTPEEPDVPTLPEDQGIFDKVITAIKKNIEAIINFFTGKK